MNTAAVMVERLDGLRINHALKSGNVVYRRLLLCGTAFGVHRGPGLLVVAYQEYEAPR